MRVSKLFASRRHTLAVCCTSVLAAAALLTALLLPGAKPKGQSVVMADLTPPPSETAETVFPTASPSPSPEASRSTQPSASPSPTPFEHGQEADGFSELWPGAMSTDGRFVVFTTWASNLAPGDGQADPDPFMDDAYGQDVVVRDVEEGTNELVSVSSKEARGNGNSFHAVISANGRFIAFASKASNLVAGDTNKTWDIFLRDRVEGTTRRVSVDSAGGQAQGESWGPSISGNGRYVVFDSLASDLVAGDSNSARDVFLHDMQTGDTTKVSVSSSEVEGNNDSTSAVISSDGSIVAFNSDASNLTPDDSAPDPDRLGWSMDLYIRDLNQGTTVRVASTRMGAVGAPSMLSLSSDGRYVAFTSAADDIVAGDSNGVEDAFVYDRESDRFTRVSVSSAGTGADRTSWDAAISADGRYVVFGSNATNIAAGDSNRCSRGDDVGWCGADVFIHDLTTGTTTLVSRSTSGLQGNGNSGMPSIAADGRFVMFESRADNLVEPDTNRCKTIDGDHEPCTDIFLRDIRTGTTTRLSDS